MISRSIIKRMSTQDKSYVKEGGFAMFGMTGIVAYYNYRQMLKKDFLRSEGHYRFNQKCQNITPWKQMYFTWWRMPEEEFNIYHKFKPYYVLGQLDYSKEILIPRTRTLEDGSTQEGFDIINPLYCYEGGRINFGKAFNKKDSIQIERAAIIINRGWVPIEYKDKRSRPHELNTRKLVKFYGVWRKGQNLHDYKIPNNPDNNDWHNLALEDIGIYWDLPNYDECKFYYFHVTDLGVAKEESEYAYPEKLSKDEIISDHYKWRFSQETNKWLFQGFGGIASASLLLFCLA